MLEKELLIVADEDVIVDPANLRFSEGTLSEYITKEGGWIDNFGGYLAKAERELLVAETYHKDLYNLHFYDLRERGKSEKTAEAGANLNPDVMKAAKKLHDLKYNVSRLKNHLKAWDKNHENAQSMGHNLRREMDRLGTDAIRSRNPAFRAYDDVDAMVQHLDPEELS